MEGKMKVYVCFVYYSLPCRVFAKEEDAKAWVAAETRFSADYEEMEVEE
jgi:hypothetical protein